MWLNTTRDLSCWVYRHTTYIFLTAGLSRPSSEGKILLVISLVAIKKKNSFASSYYPMVLSILHKFCLVIFCYLCIDVAMVALCVILEHETDNLIKESRVWLAHCQQQTHPLIQQDHYYNQLCKAHTRWGRAPSPVILQGLLIFMRTLPGILYLQLAGHDPFAGTSLDSHRFWQEVRGIRVSMPSGVISAVVYRFLNLLMDEYIRYSTMILCVLVLYIPYKMFYVNKTAPKEHLFPTSHSITMSQQDMDTQATCDL